MLVSTLSQFLTAHGIGSDGDVSSVAVGIFDMTICGIDLEEGWNIIGNDSAFLYRTDELHYLDILLLSLFL